MCGLAGTGCDEARLFMAGSFATRAAKAYDGYGEGDPPEVRGAGREQQHMGGLDLRQQQKLTQQLVMTQQLQQAIKLLQLNHLELVEHIQTELMENPTLEEVPGTRSEGLSDAEAKLASSVDAQRQDTVEQSNGAAEGSVDWNRVLDEYSQGSAFSAGSSGGQDELPSLEATLSSELSLSEHLLWQLGMLSLDEDLQRAATVVVLNLDQRGWLDCTSEQIQEEAGVDEDTAETAVKLVQTLDPFGCAARDLHECLAVQARQLWPEDPTVLRILSDHLSDLEGRNYPAIARALDLDLEDVVEYHRMIKQLEPWPGRPFGEAPSQYITPDVEVEKIGGIWQIRQNEDGMPKLRVSRYYKSVFQGGSSSKEERDYIKERLESADFLIRSIYKRHDTIQKVMGCIVERQQDFFEKGPEHLRPMILKDVADEVGVHESTVSRVTTNKYVQTPHGIFELKYFFNAGIQRLGGEDLAAEAVKQMIRKLISDEDTKSPLSDQDIVKKLSVKNIKIARRTVAKYREAMGILPSSKRSQHF